MLPEGWNTTPNLYIFRYRSTATGDIYILKVLSVDNSLLVHFWVRNFVGVDSGLQIKSRLKAVA